MFMGSPDFAVPVLQRLNESYEIVAVVTQPDQPVGRGRKLQAPPVKLAAQELDLNILQPGSVRKGSFFEDLKRLSPDGIVVAAYGKILPEEVLEFPRFGCINVHASLLPRWRGASPIQYAILHGDAQTGVTIMRMDEGLDTGAMLAKGSIEIADDDTAESLAEKLAVIGADLLEKTLPDYMKGEITPQEQDDSQATFTRLIKKQDALIDFSKTAEELERQVRAYYPWPISYFRWEENVLRVVKASISDTNSLEPEQRGIIGKYPCVGTATVDLKLLEVQPAGKRVMNGKAFINGARGWKN